MPASLHQQDRVVLRPNRLQGVLILLLAIGAGLMSMALLIEFPLAGLGGLGISGFGLKCAQSRLRRGATWIEIDSFGFRLCRNYRVQNFGWEEVDHFEIRSNQNAECSTIPMLWMIPTDNKEAVHTPSCFGKRLDEMLELVSHHHNRSQALMANLKRFESTLTTP